ncbi:T-cell leukemia translocation-altered gene protein isoform X1 [Dendrobates tinctorius]|uniref:T-cell leukemia translocation-altered gene protein isoform X1 n=1 Tax=Dendrobates tinctorius TaxID=92724 RepID=UPI003CC9B3F8
MEAAELLSPLLALVLGVCSDFCRDWESNDLRAAIFKLLLAWLLLSVTAIQLSWRKYGRTERCDPRLPSTLPHVGERQHRVPKIAPRMTEEDKMAAGCAQAPRCL